MTILENNHFRIGFREQDGAIVSLLVKKNGCELIGEPRLASAYRLLAPTAEYQGNYAESSGQKAAEIRSDGSTVTVTQKGVTADMGKLDIDLTFSVSLEGDTISFRSELQNNSDSEIAEFWFPRLGGITQFDAQQQAGLAVPGYLQCCRHDINLIRNFPGSMGLGSEAAEYSCSYPEMVMPWWDIYDKATDTGLYFGYHDETLRYSTWHTYLCPTVSGIPGRSMLSPEEAGGEPAGLQFSHVRYPFLKKGESFRTGVFLLRVHEGDWHSGSQYYRKWFMENFPFHKKDHWLRKKSAWFTSIIYQPEDKIITDYEGYDAWCRDAEKYGVDCHELIGWDKGGIERDYPEYVPEEKFGGREGYRALLASMHSRGARNLTFVNYNVFDSCSEKYQKEYRKYTHQDTFGNTPNWMAWGESTLLARKGISVRRHLLTSVVPEVEQILEDHFLELVRDGADGFQIDKLCVGSALDFNPLNTEKPDVALCEGLVQAIDRLWHKCREINPDFCMASEHGQDRLIPYFDVGYRNTSLYGISPLHYVFPEWTACLHISSPYDFASVNSAVMTGAVICMEPLTYQGSMDHPAYRKLSRYIAETQRIRTELKDVLFLGEYGDNLYAEAVPAGGNAHTPAAGAARAPGSEVMVPGGAAAAEAPSGTLHYRTHRSLDHARLALVVANADSAPAAYTCRFDAPYSRTAVLYSPFTEPRTVTAGETLEIPGIGLHILVASAE